MRNSVWKKRSRSRWETTPLPRLPGEPTPTPDSSAAGGRGGGGIFAPRQRRREPGTRRQGTSRPWLEVLRAASFPGLESVPSEPCARESLPRHPFQESQPALEERLAHGRGPFSSLSSAPSLPFPGERKYGAGRSGRKCAWLLKAPPTPRAWNRRPLCTTLAAGGIGASRSCQRAENSAKLRDFRRRFRVGGRGENAAF